ncbi:hypothetical protein T06_2056, partial [Trichinella sp. T6]
LDVFMLCRNTQSVLHMIISHYQWRRSVESAFLFGM